MILDYGMSSLVFRHLSHSINGCFLCSADLPISFEDRVAAVGIATQFQEASNEVFKMVAEETEFAKTQVAQLACFLSRILNLMNIIAFSKPAFGWNER